MALPAIGRIVHRMGDEWGLAMHADAMHDGGIALIDEALGNLPGSFGDLAEGHTRLDDPDIVLNLVVGHAIEHLLMGRRPARAAAEAAGEIGEVAVAADGIGIEGDELAGPELPAAGLVEPGIRALAGAEQPRLDELAALANHLVIEDGEELGLRDTGPDGLAQRRHRRLRPRHRDLEAFDLLGSLHGADRQDLALAIPDDA